MLTALTWYIFQPSVWSNIILYVYCVYVMKADTNYYNYAASVVFFFSSFGLYHTMWSYCDRTWMWDLFEVYTHSRHTWPCAQRTLKCISIHSLDIKYNKIFRHSTAAILLLALSSRMRPGKLLHSVKKLDVCYKATSAEYCSLFWVFICI